MTAGTNVAGFARRRKHRKNTCVAGTIPKCHKEIVMENSCVCLCIESLVKRYDM